LVSLKVTLWPSAMRTRSAERSPRRCRLVRVGYAAEGLKRGVGPDRSCRCHCVRRAFAWVSGRSRQILNRA